MNQDSYKIAKLIEKYQFIDEIRFIGFNSRLSVVKNRFLSFKIFKMIKRLFN
jgi:hypothetical protein